MGVIDDFKSDYLVLLVGSNPLPNYVAACLMLKDNGNVIFVHTAKTKVYADDIKKILSSTGHVFTYEYIEVDASDKDRIYSPLENQLKKYLSSLSSSDKSVGLNYTGGTKSMAVHVYDWVKTNVPDAIFSYLDSRTYKMLVHRKNDSVKSQEVIDLVKLDIPNLLGLHGFNVDEVKKSMKKEPAHLDAARKMAEYMKDDDNLRRWGGWCSSNLKVVKNKNDKNKESSCKNEDQSYKKDWKSGPALKKVDLPEGNLKLPYTYLTGREDVHNLNDVYEVLKDDGKLAKDEKIENIAKWLDGAWLEDYTLGCIESIAKDKEITDYCRNINVGNMKNVENPKKFEFDDAFMRGYQLFAVSCTTSADTGLCKQKAFEAYIRAAQMGGDEARLALVCYHDDPIYLQKQIESDIFEEGKVKVFGKADIPELASRLADWIKTIEVG